MLLFFMALGVVPRAFSQADTNALPALAPPYGYLPPTFREQHATAIIVFSFAFVAVALLLLRWWLRPETKVILSPVAMARAALTNLARQPETGAVLSTLSQVLRRYLVAVFALPPAEMTTAEFCAAVAAEKRIGAELAAGISSFLRACDERKFSPAPADDAPLDAVRRALEIIARAEAQNLPNTPVPGAAARPQPSPRADVAASGAGRPHA